MKQRYEGMSHRVRNLGGSHLPCSVSGASLEGVREPAKTDKRQLARGAVSPGYQAMGGAAIFDESAWGRIACSLRLSNRELEMVRGVFDDRTERFIAGHLGISPHTVHTYFDRLHRKLGVANRVQLILRITQQFLVLATLTGTSGVSSVPVIQPVLGPPGDRR